MGSRTGSVINVKTTGSTFLRACRCEASDRAPVWFMRQAGRSLPEYRALKGDLSILDAVERPELAAELTLQPVTRYGVDAAILFSDIMVPLVGIGIDLEVVPGKGPVIAEPFRDATDLARLRPLDAASDVPYVAEAVRIAAKELEVPLIGFAGGPFTLASYLIEGGPSRVFSRTRTLMHSEPNTWMALMDSLASVAISSLRAQILAGASAIQLFDSWIGWLSLDEYATFVLPATKRIFAGLEDLDVPRIYFGINTSDLLSRMSTAGADVIGVDWRIGIAAARERIGNELGIQGNLNPATCLGPWETVEHETARILQEASAQPGHIFNLGHGVLPETNPEVLEKVVALVHGEQNGAAL
ncbi:MAG: uroporphyrinogen decarboxylase [Acidimicrobiales bacterium]